MKVLEQRRKVPLRASGGRKDQSSHGACREDTGRARSPRALSFMRIFGAAALGAWVMLCPYRSSAQSASLVFTSTTGVATGVAALSATPSAGFDEEIVLNGRLQTGPLRVTALASVSFSTGLASLGRWSVFSSGQTLRWSWPAWSSRAASPDTLASIEIEELAAALSGTLAHTGFRIELGKFPLKWGVGKAFRPSDIFKTMDYASLIPASKGLPAARLALFPSPLSRFEAVASIDGDSTVTAGARYLTALGDTAAIAASGGRRRQTGAADEYSGSFEGQIDAGIFTPYTELSVRTDGSSAYAITMLGSSLAAGDVTLWLEGQASFGPATMNAQLFLLGTWKVSELTSVSMPVFWFDDARILSASALAQFQGILDGRLDITATGRWLSATTPPGFLWKLSAYWTRSLSTY